MCTSQAEGGQRCFASAQKSLAAAHEKKVTAEVEYLSAVAANAPAPERERLLRRGLAAEHTYEDALSQYASTDTGRADLETRLATAPRYHQANQSTHPDREDDYATLDHAIQEGRFLQERAAETKRAARAGEISPETARMRTEFPTEFARSHRARRIEDTVARIMAQPHRARPEQPSGEYPSQEPNQVRYRVLFAQRNALTDLIHTKQQDVEDAADAHEINELAAQLAAIDDEMESLETWRRRADPDALAEPNTRNPNR